MAVPTVKKAEPFRLVLGWGFSEIRRYVGQCSPVLSESPTDWFPVKDVQAAIKPVIAKAVVGLFPRSLNPMPPALEGVGRESDATPGFTGEQS